MSSDSVITVENLSKCYVIEHESRHDNLRDTLHHTARKLWRRFRWGTGFQKEEFWALRDVSFEVKRGEVVGIIGRNGAGKSTLLKILSRITEPTEGTVTIKGRVASLLEVGTGFHPELTGRENVFLNGAILGMSRAEIRRKFDEIVAFAEVEKFLDTPVKHYSSGMYVRLAFAVAAHLEPEILIVDEVLAVGDAAFQKKCLGKMEKVASGGRTILFVSHNISAVAHICPRTLLLDRGRLLLDGRTDAAINGYIGSDRGSTETGIDLTRVDHVAGAPVKLLSLSLNDGQPLVNRRAFTAVLRFHAARPVTAGFGLGFSNIDGSRILTLESDYNGRFHEIPRAGEYNIILRLPILDLIPGCYHVDIGAFGAQHEGYHYHPKYTLVEVEPGPNTPPHLHGANGDWRPASDWQLMPA